MARASIAKHAVGLLAAAAIGCSFPSVTFAPSDAGAATDSASASDGASGDANDPCDRDRDGYPAAGACGGLDCDDEDAHANPGVMQFLTYLSHAPTYGDWNCDGTAEKKYAKVTCSVVQVGAACDGTVGFADDPACGSTGTLVHCTTQNLLCGIDTPKNEFVVQACR